MHSEKRAAPRAVGRLLLTYRVGGDVVAWLSGAPPATEVHRPEPDMNFNHLGLAFDDAETCRDGNSLLLEMDLADLGVHRAAAEVVRVSRVPIDEWDEGGATHRIAVRIVAYGARTEEALRAYTARTLGNRTD